eukprot:51497-Chlamydomonas_euryale.AAC.10
MHAYNRHNTREVIAGNKNGIVEASSSSRKGRMAHLFSDQRLEVRIEQHGSVLVRTQPAAFSARDPLMGKNAH